ncbi:MULTISPECIES: hypothetical protein [Bradyrhizobium]|jgi:hypothetical protein|uniref:hypothetical protein n=1 Tax=Bradyrhizobium TaxID=374 RepID=UPI00005DFD1D|nr:MULTISPECIES: hypothetical protein [Bradyrhizobium]ABQ36154.1 hypothetical protein BBta_4088 [Bradyrhizobium sp. BTAi1]MCL8484899.1 hypothetical protein [Bradyrhizobium denitrificans]RTL91123.1 MAG: hypothetical protein EKK32_33530 [Bradyrhizobiaceae bacterium]
MQSTQNVQQIDPSEVGLAPEKPGKASYDQLYRRVLREVLTRIDTRLAAIERPGVAADAAAAASTAEATSAEGGRWARLKVKIPLGKLRGRTGVGLALLALLVGGSVAWSQRDATTSLMDRWMPSSAEASQDEASGQGHEDGMMSNASLRGSDDGAASGAGGGPTTMMQRMARDIAELQQGIEQIKATQDQASRDHTRAIEQLQAGQDQLMRLVSRMSNQAAQARGTAPPQQQIIVNPQRTTTGLARPQPAQPQQQGSTIGTFLTRNTSGIQSPMPR